MARINARLNPIGMLCKPRPPQLVYDKTHHRIVAFVPENLYQRLREAAITHDCSRQELIRRALTAYLTV